VSPIDSLGEGIHNTFQHWGMALLDRTGKKIDKQQDDSLKYLPRITTSRRRSPDRAAPNRMRFSSEEIKAIHSLGDTSSLPVHSTVRLVSGRHGIVFRPSQPDPNAYEDTPLANLLGESIQLGHRIGECNFELRTKPIGRETR
jgi:hypothetical protein